MRLSRTDRSLLAQWWFTVDRQLCAAILILIAVGFMLSLAASPAVAQHKGLGTLYFVKRHAIFAIAATPSSSPSLSCNRRKSGVLASFSLSPCWR